jgi:hypothetical protein
MSDYIPKDPLGPNNGNGPQGYDRYGNTRFEPADDAGKGPYILLGLLVAIGLIGGLLYFNGSPKGGDNVAQAPATPPSISRTVTPPAAPATPMPSATPATPSTPSATPAAPSAPAPSATPAPSPDSTTGGGTTQQ